MTKIEVRQEFTDRAGLKTVKTKTGGRRRWFTEGAYVRRIESGEYVQEVITYVENQR